MACLSQQRCLGRLLRTSANATLCPQCFISQAVAVSTFKVLGLGCDYLGASWVAVRLVLRGIEIIFREC